MRNSGGQPLYVVCDCPYLYRLNPEHPGINSHGLRDKEYAEKKPVGTTRILMLGDSVTYGRQVLQTSTYEYLLEQRLADRHFEIINAGVEGYTPYNELQYYITEGRNFDPDIVIVTFVMNDVADPALHWNYTQTVIDSIPQEAIPNYEYHQDHIESQLTLNSSALYRLVRTLVSKIAEDENKYTVLDGKRWPTFITGEDTISIKVLLDDSSPEWRWLSSMYDQLNQAVANDGATFMILIIPVSYQLEADYPYLPQKLFSRYCTDRQIPCLDMLPALQKYKQEDVFWRTRLDYDDIWHLTETGHQIVAETLFDYLVEHDLVH